MSQQTEAKSRTPCPTVTIFIFFSSTGINSLIANNIYEAAYPLHDVSIISARSAMAVQHRWHGGRVHGRQGTREPRCSDTWADSGLLGPDSNSHNCLSGYYPNRGMNWFWWELSPCAPRWFGKGRRGMMYLLGGGGGEGGRVAVEESKTPGNTHPGWSDPGKRLKMTLCVIVLCGCEIPHPG